MVASECFLNTSIEIPKPTSFKYYVLDFYSEGISIFRKYDLHSYTFKVFGCEYVFPSTRDGTSISLQLLYILTTVMADAVSRLFEPSGVLPLTNCPTTHWNDDLVKRDYILLKVQCGL